jgi:hypothetical protein
VWVDGSLYERIEGEKDLERPIVRFRLKDVLVEEQFSASPEALDGLEAFVQSGASPPWSHFPERYPTGSSTRTSRSRRADGGRSPRTDYQRDLRPRRLV